MSVRLSVCVFQFGPVLGRFYWRYFEFCRGTFILAEPWTTFWKLWYIKNCRGECKLQETASNTNLDVIYNEHTLISTYPQQRGSFLKLGRSSNRALHIQCVTFVSSPRLVRSCHGCSQTVSPGRLALTKTDNDVTDGGHNKHHVL
jgi:hypothetical protein